MSKKNYVLQVIKTKDGWTIKSNHSLGSSPGADSVDLRKQTTVNRAHRIAVNRSKKEGATVTLEIYSAAGNLQSETQW